MSSQASPERLKLLLGKKRGSLEDPGKGEWKTARGMEDTVLVSGEGANKFNTFPISIQLVCKRVVGCVGCATSPISHQFVGG